MANLAVSIINLYILVVIVRVVLSWVGYERSNQFTEFIYQATEPVLCKIRSVLPDFGGLDLSPMVLILALYILRGIFVY